MDFGEFATFAWGPEFRGKAGKKEPLQFIAAAPLGESVYLRLASRASIFLMGSMMEPTLISWLMAATK